MGLKLLEECSNKFISQTTKVFINGIWVGNVRNPVEIVNNMKSHRRNNLIDIYTSINFNIRLNEIIIFTDAGRPTRPLFYVDNETLSFNRDNVLKLLSEDKLSWEKCIRGFGQTQVNLLDKETEIKMDKTQLIKNAAVVEYIDTNEGEGMVLAKSTYKEEEYAKHRVTHCEIHPSLILSFMANQIIFPEHNQYPRKCFFLWTG